MPQVQVEVLDVTDQTPTIRSVKLSKPAGFTFKPGQFCLFKIGMDDHAFSLSCSPEKDYLEFATRNSDSQFKKKFFSLQKGDPVFLMGPMGKFVLDESEKNVVLLSGGIGITPLKSMLEHAFDKKLDSKFTLLYSNKTPSEIAFKKELDSMQSENIKVVYSVSEPDAAWKGNAGRISEELIKSNCDVSKSVFYVCGPPGMVQGLKDLLKQMGVEDARVKFELFSGYK